MINFRPFRQWFVSKPGRLKKDLIEKAGLHPSTSAKVWKDENVTLDTVDKICDYYDLNIEQVIEFIPNKKGESE